MKIKFLNLNIWYGQLLDAVIELVKRENPDIICLQEVYNGKDADPAWLNSWSVLQEELDYPYVSFAPAFYVTESGVKIDQGQAVMSKHPIGQQQTFFYDVPYGEFSFPAEDFSFVPRNLQQVMIKVSDTELNIFNTQGIWGKDELDSERRIKMSKEIIRRAGRKSHVILSGDFNVLPGTETMRAIEKVFLDSLAGKMATSMNAKRANKAIHDNRSILDRFFVSSDLTIIDAYSPDADVSDHMPLVVVAELE